MGTSSLQKPIADGDPPATLARSACGRGMVRDKLPSTVRGRALQFTSTMGTSSLQRRIFERQVLKSQLVRTALSE